MDTSDVKQLICTMVEESQGCKATELVCRIAELHDEELMSFDITFLIQELVDAKELVEVEYTLPNVSYRLKSFLLPKGTEAKIGT